MRFLAFFSRRTLVLPFAALAFAACGGGSGGGFGNSSLVKLTTAAIDPATTGIPFSQTLTADFPHAPGIFSVTSGALPLGLTLNKQTGELSGYPRQTGNFQFSISARDGADSNIPQNRDATFAEDRKTYTMRVALGPPNILPQQPPAGQYRSSYSYQIDCAGGTQPYTFTHSGGTLPNGITISPSGVLGSFPTAAVQHPYTFQVTVTDANGLTDVETMTIDIVVLPLLILTPPNLPEAAAGFPYDTPLDLASSGAGQPIVWSQQLPLGVGEVTVGSINMEVANLAGAGRFRVAAPNQGPSAAGLYKFTLKVTDESGQIATRQFTFKVNAGPVLSSVVPNKASAGTPITLTGLNFQVGAVVIFRPGPSQVQVNPSQLTPTTIQLNSVPATPGSGGFVTVRVKNPDGGFSDKAGAYAFPATNLTFSSTPIFPAPNSTLSSTGVDAGDVNKDGFADFVHCGSNSSWSNATGNTNGVDLMLNTPPGGVFTAGTPTFTRVQLAAAGVGDWYEVKLSDVDTDTDLDVVALGSVGGNSVVRVWKNPYPAAFTAAVVPITTSVNSSSGSFSQHVQSMAISRLGTDLVPDLAYVQPDYPSTTFSGSSQPWYAVGGRVATMQGGGGTFSGLDIASGIYGISRMSGVAITDVDGTTHRDVVVTDGYQGWMVYAGFGGTPSTFLWVNTATTGDLFGSWTGKSSGNENGICESLCVTPGDVNGDGQEDLLVTKNVATGGISGGLIQYTKTGANSYASVNAQLGSSGAFRYATVLDADFDSTLDAAATVGTSRVDFFKGRTGNTGLLFKQTVTVSTGSPKVGKLASGDFDNDGRADVCVTTSFLSDAYDQIGYGIGTSDRGVGSTQGVFILLNTSN